MAEFEVDPPVARKVKLILSESELCDLRGQIYSNDLENYIDAWDAIDGAYQALDK